MTTNQSDGTADDSEVPPDFPRMSGTESLELRPTTGNEVRLQAADGTDILTADSATSDVSVPNGEISAQGYPVDYSKEYPQAPRQADIFDFPALAQHPNVDNPIFGPGDFTLSNGNAVSTVADPFIVREGAMFYLFFEAKESAEQEIHYATSPDGLAWTHQGAVLTDGTLSYPQVLKHDGAWYMMPMTTESTDITVYRGDSFPGSWTADTTITIPTYDSRDATVFQHDEYWWLMWSDTDATGNTIVRLAYETRFPADGWTEHPDSPIRSAGTIERPGGRPFVHQDYVDIPFQARTDGIYGRELRLYRATTLTPDQYTDAELSSSPVLQGNAAGSEKYSTWNSVRMHHVDHCLGSEGEIALAVVDGGRPTGEWSLGIFSPTDTLPVGAELSLSSTQTVDPNSRTQVTLDQVLLDTHRQLDGANHTWTAPRSGWYRISAQFGIRWTPTNDGRVTLDLVDGSDGSVIIRSNTIGNASATYQSLALRPRLVHLSTGQSIRMEVTNTLDSSFDILSGTDQSAVVIERAQIPG